MDVAINNITTTITVPQVDFNLLKELAKSLAGLFKPKRKVVLKKPQKMLKQAEYIMQKMLTT